MNGVGVTGTRATYVNPLDKMSTTTDVNDLAADLPKEGTPIFLQTRAAQVIAGVFVSVALFLTCQQVWRCQCGGICQKATRCVRWLVDDAVTSLSLLFVDLSASEVVHESHGAEMDSANFVYRAHLCHLLLDFTVVLQQ